MTGSAWIARAALLAGMVSVVTIIRVNADEMTPLSPAQVEAFIAAPEVQQGRAGLHDRKREAEVIAHFNNAAKAGNPVAETYLGYLSYMGYGVQQNDRAAVEWYQRAAERGFTDAQVRIGILYIYGRPLGDLEHSVSRDEPRGWAWIQRAADGGNALALDLVADRLSTVVSGATPSQSDLDRAVELFARAAAQGDRYAVLALCGMQRDPVTLAPLRKPCAMTSSDARIVLAGPDTGILSSDEIPMKPH